MPTWSWSQDGNEVTILQGEGYGNIVMKAQFAFDCMNLDYCIFRARALRESRDARAVSARASSEYDGARAGVCVLASGRLSRKQRFGEA
jgi:hypothetical protein